MSQFGSFVLHPLEGLHGFCMYVRCEGVSDSVSSVLSFCCYTQVNGI